MDNLPLNPFLKLGFPKFHIKEAFDRQKSKINDLYSCNFCTYEHSQKQTVKEHQRVCLDSLQISMLKENPLFVNEESYASGVKQSFQEKGVKMTADKNSDNDSEEEEPSIKERETKKKPIFRASKSNIEKNSIGKKSLAQQTCDCAVQTGSQVQAKANTMEAQERQERKRCQLI